MIAAADENADISKKEEVSNISKKEEVFNSLNSLLDKLLSVERTTEQPENSDWKTYSSNMWMHPKPSILYKKFLKQNRRRKHFKIKYQKLNK